MTSGELRAILERARESAQRVNMLSLRVRENVQVNQRLTAMYGKERVKAGGTFEDPTLKALIEFEEWEEDFRSELEDAVNALQAGKELVRRLPHGLHRDVLFNYYCLGWNHARIAKLHGWKSKSSVRRTLQNAFDDLLERIKKEGQE